MSVFRAIAATGQSIALNTFSQVNFGTEVFDPASIYATNEITIPAGLNGQYGVVSAGIETAATANPINYYIQVDTGGGYGGLAQTANVSSTGITVSTGVVLFNTGDKYRVMYYGAAATTVASEATYFAAHSFTSTNVFRATVGATQAISTATETEITFGSETFDPDTVFASNRFTVPAGWNNLYGHLFANLRFSTDEVGRTSIQRSTDSGSNWEFVASKGLSSVTAASLQAGPILMTTGHIYRVTHINSGAATVNNASTVNFSGYAA